MTQLKSKKPKKQRFSRHGALHERGRLLRARLDKKLQAEFKQKNVRVRKDDVVIVLKGEGKGKKGKVLRVNQEKGVVFVEGLNRKRADGKEQLVAMQPSNLMIMELNSTDSLRFGTKKTASKKATKEDA